VLIGMRGVVGDPEMPALYCRLGRMSSDWHDISRRFLTILLAANGQE
jgi:hypothetical protein